MDENTSAQQVKRQEELEKVRQELYRKSLDEIKVYNPLNEDRVCVYGGFNHVVKAKNEAVFPRYIANKYVKETVDYLINEEEKREFEKADKKRNEPMTPQQREQFDTQRGLTTGNLEKRKVYIEQVYKGIVREYGLDLVPQQPQKPLGPTQDQDLLDEIDEKAPEPEPITKVVNSEKKERLVKNTSEK